MKSFEKEHGRKPIAGIDFDPDGSMCQDDYEYFTGTGRYSEPECTCWDTDKNPFDNVCPIHG